MVQSYRSFWLQFTSQSLYLNSIYLLVSTGVMAGLGFIYWFLAARLYTSAEVGIAVTLVSVMTYVSTISQLGLNISLIKYLPNAPNKQAILDTSFTIVMVIALLASTLFLIGSKILVPNIVFLIQNHLIAVSFIIFLVFAALNITLESVFIAQRNAALVLAKNSFLSVLKVGFLFFFISFGAYGLFSSWAIATVIVIICGFTWLRMKGLYRFHPHIYGREIKKMAAFSGGNYFASLLSSLPLYILPLMLTTLLNPSATAYYNVAMSYATLLFSIPLSVCNSLFAEGATDENLIKINTYRAIKLIVVILVPAIAIILIFGETGLRIFGAEYSSNSAHLLSILTLSSIFIAINTVCWTILNLKRKVRQVVVTLALNAAILIALSRLLIGNGLTGIGIAWLAGQAITSVVYLVIIYWSL